MTDWGWDNSVPIEQRLGVRTRFSYFWLRQPQDPEVEVEKKSGKRTYFKSRRETPGHFHAYGRSYGLVKDVGLYKDLRGHQELILVRCREIRPWTTLHSR